MTTSLFSQVVEVVAAALIALLIILVTGCAHLDPLGSPAAGVKGKADFPTKAGVICRELAAGINATGIEGSGRGGRCLEIGEGELTGCVTYDDGRLKYTSSGCNERP